MAGKALKRRILADVAAQGGVDYLFDRIGSGVTVARLAEEYGCSRTYLSRALNSVPEYAAAMAEARVEAADAFADEGLAIVDTLGDESTTAQVGAVRERVGYRKFLAGALNANRYGLRQQTNVQINVGDLHLDALRKVNVELAEIEAEDRQRAVDV